jgi:hypothetical protein
MPPVDRWAVYALLAATLLMGTAWILETWALERSIANLSRSLAVAEEGMYERKWEDAHIRYGYFLFSGFAMRANRLFSLVEPLPWTELAVVIFTHRLGSN